jgi:2-polyprenyl-6-methoxyphenol hydroxylase-like FAD-dependent oxidoreductase
MYFAIELGLKRNTMTFDKQEILIIGGGIGGMTLALELHSRGLPCQIYEATPEFKPLGVGINMLPHALRVLTNLGLEPSLRKNGIEAREFTYYNRHGQAIFVEPCGRFAGYDYPHFSIHRGDLHKVLFDAVVERLGSGAVHLNHSCTGVEQDVTSVRVFFDGQEPRTGSVAIGADGFHSVVRKQFYQSEGNPHFDGINMWRGVTRRKPFLSGASVTRIGTVARGKMTIYPIRKFDDGTQLINWVTEQPREDQMLNDWAKPGRIEDFIEPFADWHFDWLDIPDLINNADYILEYPMVDRDPIDRWTFGRVTLLGDAAHPMYPRGGNGGAQAILDAELLAQLLDKMDGAPAALQAYEENRRDKTSKIVMANRDQPPDYLIEKVDQLTNGEPFRRIQDVIDLAELVAISDQYKEIAGYTLDINE